MYQIQLAEPMLEHKDDAMQFRDECLTSDEIVHGGGGLGKAATYEDWLAHLRLMSDEQTVPQGLVPSSTYFAVDKTSGMIVGMIDIRHRLNEFLAIRGGHIGYGIRPALRGRGFAPAMLALALIKCEELGLEKVLITCYNENIPSAKTAMHCGGVEEFTEISVREGFRRFWIAIGESGETHEAHHTA